MIASLPKQQLRLGSRYIIFPDLEARITMAGLFLPSSAAYFGMRIVMVTGEWDELGKII